MPIAAAYCRVSTQDQRDHGTSLETQRTAIVALLQARGYTVPEEYVVLEDWSGADLARPGLQRVLQWAETGVIQAVGLYTLDRLHRPDQGEEWRTSELLWRLTQAGCKPLSVDNTIDVDSPVFGLLTSVFSWKAGQERRDIRERMMRGKRAAARAGRLPGGTRRDPYGYTYDRVNKVRHVVEEEAAVVREMFARTIAGEAQRSIAADLNRRDIPTKEGSRWIQGQIHAMLKNPIYKGITRFQDIEFTGFTPPIVTAAEWEAAQNVPKRLGGRPQKGFTPYLLTGFARCASCGQRILGHRVKGFRYYRCMGERTRWPGLSGATCHAQGGRAGVIEEAVWAKVSHLLSNMETLAARMLSQYTDTTAHLDKEEQALRHRLEETHRQEQRAIRLAIIGADEEKVLAEITRIRARRSTLEADLAAIGRRRTAVLDVQRAVAGLRSLVEEIGDVQALDTEGRRGVLRKLGAVITLQREEVDVRLPAPAEGVSALNGSLASWFQLAK